MQSYHKLMKDENIDPSGWSEEATSLGHAREIKFLKVVNLPGLATTRAKKVRLYDLYIAFYIEIILWTISFVSFSFSAIGDSGMQGL